MDVDLQARVLELEAALIEACDALGDESHGQDDGSDPLILRLRAIVGRELLPAGPGWNRDTPGKVADKVLEQARAGALVDSSPTRTKALIAAAVNGARIRAFVEAVYEADQTAETMKADEGAARGARAAREMIKLHATRTT